MEKNIYSGWEKTGLYPFKPEVVLDKFMEKEASMKDGPSSSKSSKLVLTAADWVRIKKKLKEVIVNVFDSRVKELSNTIQSLAVTNIILKSQVKGY